MKMVADEHNISMADKFGTATSSSVPGNAEAGGESAQGQAAAAGGGGGEDTLEERLRKLRQG